MPDSAAEQFYSDVFLPAIEEVLVPLFVAGFADREHAVVCKDRLVRLHQLRRLELSDKAARLAFDSLPWRG
jgi:hypothetical protein